MDNNKFPTPSVHGRSCMAERDSTSETTYMNETKEIGSVTNEKQESALTTSQPEKSDSMAYRSILSANKAPLPYIIPPVCEGESKQGLCSRKSCVLV